MLKRLTLFACLLSTLFGASDTLNITITITDVTLSVDETITPTEFKFHPATPNPFNNQVSLQWDLDHSGQVNLVIFDLLGRKVWNQSWKNANAGEYQIKWNGKDNFGQNLSGGIYLVQLKMGQKISRQKIILLK